MRRLYLVVTFLCASAWLLWSACERDDYRNELPLRPLDGGIRPVPADMPVDAAKPVLLDGGADLPPAQDLPASVDMPAATDMKGPSDGGTAPDGAMQG